MTETAVLLARPAGLPERVGAVLSSQAKSWARELASGGFYECPDGAKLLDEVERLPGPAVIIWPAVARLRREHLRAALDDLGAGCEVVFGPLVDGGFYLLGFRELLPLVRDLLVDGSPAADALAAAAESGLEIGYLRPERALTSAEGMALALADPLTPEKIRQLLAG